MTIGTPDTLNRFDAINLATSVSTEEICKQIFVDVAEGKKLDGKYGIREILRAGELPDDLDCVSFIFGKDHVGLKLYQSVARAPLSIDPEPFNLAVYGWRDDGEGIRHVGVVTQRREVISKWQTRGNVYEHPSKHVPMTYGPVEFRKVDLKEILEHAHPSLSKFMKEGNQENGGGQFDYDQLEKTLHRQLDPIKPYKIICKSIGDEYDFRLNLFESETFVSTFKAVQIKDFSQLPMVAQKILTEQHASGAKIFSGVVATDDVYTGRGIGTALWKYSTEKMVETFSSPIVRLIQDDSTKGWTTRTLPKVNDYIQALGFNTQLLWSGVMDNKDSWVIRYLR